MRTSGAISLFSLALALYVTPFVQAAPRSGPHPGRQLSDQNLFEVHLQQAAAGSHKRLPSDLLNHHERSEEEEKLVGDVVQAADDEVVDVTAAPVSTPDSESSSSQAAYSARQPSHFIKHFKHRSNKLGKRRLTDQAASIHFERDSESLDSSIWQVPALVARAFEINAKLWQRESSSVAGELLSFMIMYAILH